MGPVETVAAIAVPLEAEHVERIHAADPSVTVLYEPELLPPERYPADHSGDPAFQRAPEQEERYWQMLGPAQVLYGFPNDDAAGLARIAVDNPHRQWIQATRQRHQAHRAPLDGIEEVTDNDGLAGLLPAADAAVNTVPATAVTEKQFNRGIFNAMKPGTVFVNVGRGSAMDEQALLETLDNGQVSHACLDVFAVEPLPPDSPLWTRSRVMVSPHTSALSAAENRLSAERFASNLRTFLDGGDLPHTVDTVHFY